MKCQATQKRCYRTQKLASQVTTKMWAKQAGESLGDLHSYKCEYCGFYHVGHNSKLPLPAPQIEPIKVEETLEIKSLKAALEMFELLILKGEI